MNVSIFKDLFKSSDVPYIYSLEKTLERIKIGKSKELIEKIRLAKTKDERNELKKKLPCIIFAGEFSERSKKGLIKHSGLMIIDFDGFEDEEKLNEQFDLLKKNPFIYSLFRSPSNDGIKGLVKIPQCNEKDHTRYFNQFEKEFNYDYWDSSNCDVSRVCFESYDPNIYINNECETYKPTLIDEGYTITEKVPLLPIDDEGVIIEKIMKFNWGKDFIDGQKQNFIFDIAGAFCEYGISYNTAESYLMYHFIQGQCNDERSKINTIKSAYKKRQAHSKYFEDYVKIDKIKAESNKGFKHIEQKYKIDEPTFDEIKESIEHDNFWYYVVNQKTGASSLKIDPLKYKNFLERNGFKKYFPNESVKASLVKINSNKVSITSADLIKDFVLNYLMETSNLDVWSYCANYQTLFSDAFLTMLSTIELRMLKDTKDISYIAYQNGILEITKKTVKLVDFIDVDYYIWESHIIKRDFERVLDHRNDYQAFINNISNNNPLSIECSIGYLISTYKNKMNNKAVILNDEVISENPEGGTGKGLFVQGISKVRRVSILDGKSFDDTKSFPYQTLNAETQVLVFDDVKQNFNFESKFSLVTEGLTLERKNKDAIKLSVEESPKLLLSTNYAIKGEGNSHDRRRHELEFSQYYNGQRTPHDEFKRQLFDDWVKEDWIKFDNYMVYCLQMYLNNGLIKQEAKNIKTRKLIAETSLEFWDWANDNLHKGIKIDKIAAFEQFIDACADFKKHLTRKRFNIWCQKYANFIDIEYLNGPTKKWFSLGPLNDDSFEDDNELPY
jgi:hypothetical protein